MSAFLSPLSQCSCMKTALSAWGTAAVLESPFTSIPQTPFFFRVWSVFYSPHLLLFWFNFSLVREHLPQPPPLPVASQESCLGDKIFWDFPCFKMSISLSHWCQCAGYHFLLNCFLPFSFLLTHSVLWPHSSHITSLGKLWDSYYPFLGLFTLDGTEEGSSLLHWHPLRKRLQCAWFQESPWRLENQVTTWGLEGRPSVHRVLKLVSLLEHHRKVPRTGPRTRSRGPMNTCWASRVSAGFLSSPLERNPTDYRIPPRWSLLNILRTFLSEVVAVVLNYKFSVIILPKNLYTHSFKMSPYIMSIFYIYPFSMKVWFLKIILKSCFSYQCPNKVLFLQF